MNMILDDVEYSETINHLLIKKYFFDNLSVSNNITKIEQEIKIGNRIADIHVELKNGKKVVIEIQHSKISSPEIIQRTKEYNEEGKHVLWILDGAGPFDKKPKNEDWVFTSSAENQLHIMYRGRVYYMNAAKEGIMAPLYALHFTPYFENKISSFGAKYFKKSKKKRSVVSNEIHSLELTLFRHKGFKLARFTDKYLKDSCTSEVIHFIDTFIAYQNKKPNEVEGLTPNGLTLGIIIKKFQAKYGLYLLFDVLRSLKFVNSADAIFMFNEKYWFQKCIIS
ncbi:MAG: competence protein CoiA family protein [Promethearchaeota archaeon]